MKPIWVVDDDASIRFVLEKALQKAGMEVRSFSNPREVLSAIAESCPQVLVSDIRMPGDPLSCYSRISLLDHACYSRQLLILRFAITAVISTFQLNAN